MEEIQGVNGGDLGVEVNEMFCTISTLIAIETIFGRISLKKQGLNKIAPPAVGTINSKIAV